MSIPLSSPLLILSPTSACTTTTVALAAVTAATAAAAVGIAYWSSSTNTSSVGTVLLEFLRATGYDIKEDNDEDDDDDNDSITSDIKKNKDYNTNINTSNDKEAFLLSLLDEKDDDYDNGFYAQDDEDLTNTRWISETIRDAIVSITATAITKKKKKKTKKLLNDEDEDETKTEIKEESKEEFYRSFRILHKAIKETNIQKPNIREDYFNGVGTIMDDEKEVEQLLTYLRFVELAKDEVYDAYWSSSSSVEFDHEQNCITNNIFTTNNSKHTIISPFQKQRHKQRRRRFKRMMVPDSNGYELHRCVATPIIIDDDNNANKSIGDDDDDHDARRNTVVVGHLVAIHRSRKEIIIAVHYDDKNNNNNNDDDDACDGNGHRRSSSSSARSRMKNTLTGELFLQHQQEQDHRTTHHRHDEDEDDDATASTASTECSTNNGCDSDNKSSSSYNSATTTSSTAILDQATDYLLEEILHYLRSTKVIVTGYNLIVCGHSIGAALACRLGIALKNSNDNDNDIYSRGISFNGNESKSESKPESESMTEQLGLRVYAFGLPPVCLPTNGSRQRSHYCDESGGGGGGDDDDDDEHHSGDNNDLNKNNEDDYSFITSIINNHDCIPRWTQSNLTVLQKQLRWTMDQKKLHVRQHYNYNNSNHFYDNQSYRCSGRQQQTTATLPPPFVFSFKEWKKFWKNCKREEKEDEEEQTEEIHQKRNGQIHCINNNGNDPKNYKNRNNVEYIVPGKIVCIWNNTQDSTIIGTNVYHHHRPIMRTSTNVNNNNHRRHNNYNNVLGRIWIDESMFYDNTLEAYRSNLELLLGQAANTI
jgi:hypothetical protein